MDSAGTYFPDELTAPPRGLRCPELLGLHDSESTRHIVQFYEDDSVVIENAAYLAARTIAAGDSAVLIATNAHLNRIGERLAGSDLALSALLASRRLVPLDAEEVLSQITVEGRPDEAKFEEVIGGIVRDALEKSAHRFVFAFGEMVDLLCSAGKPDAAVSLEQLWNSIATRQRLSLYCAYSLSSLGSEPDADALMEICAEHALTIPPENPL